MPREKRWARGRRKPQHSRVKNPKREADKQLQVLQHDVDSYKSRCLFPEDESGALCEEAPSRCHVIPRQSVLDKLKDEKSGKVLEFDWGVNQWKYLLLASSPGNPVDLEDPATFEPRHVGTHEACTGPFACQPHDGVFNPSLDTDSPDFGDPDVRRLATGRVVLYAADLASKSKFLVDKWNKQFELMRRTNRKQVVQWAMKMDLADRTYRAAHSAAERWRGAWRYGDRGADLRAYLVDWRALTFRSTLTFAACTFYGEGTAVMVLPSDKEHHKMTILYFREESAKIKEDKERLAQKARDTEEADAYGVSMISELMSRGSGVVAASPASYKELGDEDRLAIQRIIMGQLRFWEAFVALRG